MTQQEAWLWRDLPYPAHTDGEAEVWFSPVQTANQERAKLFHIAGVYQELVALKSSVTGRKYRLKYHLGAKLGAVYLGFTEDEAGNPTKFAVKRLDANIVERHQAYGNGRSICPHSMENSAMEVHVMRRLGKDCPNLQRLEEYLHCGGDFPMYFQILPCADEDLLEHIKGLQLEATHIYHFARGILNGLASLHANGLCHLDISPENVLLYKGEPVLHDFGMATDYPINSNCKDLMPRVSGGKKGYLPPEVNYLYRPYDGVKADVYSLGCTLYSAYCRIRCPPETGEGSLGELGLIPLQVYLQKYEKMHTILEERASEDSNPVLAKKISKIIAKMVRISPLDRPTLEQLLHYFDLVQNGLAPSLETMQQQYLASETRQKAVCGL